MCMYLKKKTTIIYYKRMASHLAYKSFSFIGVEGKRLDVPPLTNSLKPALDQHKISLKFVIRPVKRLEKSKWIYMKT